MVAYSFKAQFAAPIASGTKRQTIRAERKRHAQLGETLQLYTGMRTRHCRLIGLAVCVGVGPVQLDFADERITLWTGVTLVDPDDLEAYAARDGFGSWEDMMLFWADAHPTMPIFSGIAIEWGDTFQAVAAP